MAVDVTLNNISSGYNLTKINANFTAIETALQDAVSLSGTTPNSMSASLDMNSQKIINLLDPTNNQDAVTKKYGDDNYGGAAVTAAAASAAAALASENAAAASAADAAADAVSTAADAVATAADAVSTAANAAIAQAAAAGVRWKNPCVVATQGNITLSGEQTIDGVLTSSDRVLVMNQTAPAENGIYVSDAGAWSRASDMDGVWDDEVPNAVTAIQQGTVSGDKVYMTTSNEGGTLGTTDMVWTVWGVGDLVSTNNLSDLTNIITARSNLGLEIGVDVQAYSTNLADRTADASWSGSQRSPFVTDNDGSFDMGAGQNFKCTPTATVAITFTNMADGQSGVIILDNSGGYQITNGTGTSSDGVFNAVVSIAGTYAIGYLSDGTTTWITGYGEVA